MNKKVILNDIIVAYRELIRDRYQYQNIAEHHELPQSFSEDKMNLLKDYFLDYIYPPPATRLELDEAFDSLTNHIDNPAQIIRILLDSGGLVLRYGIHLPKILKAGLKALQSFKAATQLENHLVNAAIKKELSSPYSGEDLNNLIRTIPRSIIHEFIEDTLVLFETLHDRKLVKKIIEIVNKLIAKMKKKPNLYSAKEVRGLEVGRDIITEGDLLFSKLADHEQDQLFHLIAKIERKTIEDLYG